MRKHILTIITLMALLPLSPQAVALAISEAELNSYLNQQLDARIYLLSATESELSSLRININVADQAGNQRVVALQHEIKENLSGNYISITSRDAIREPILSFQLELVWSDGRMIREYSLIIDPQ